MTALPVYDVAVVGAGPAGAATALRLARAGWQVLLLDRARFPRAKACAEYFSPGVVSALQELGCWQSIAALPHARLAGMELVAPGGGRHLVAYPAGAGPRQALAMRRELLDEALVAAAGQAGVTLALGAVVTSLRVRPGEPAELGVRAASGEPLERTTPDAFDGGRVRARLVVGADGARSQVARWLGLEAPLRWPARLGLVTHYRGVHGLRDHGELHVGRGVYLGLAPLGGGEVNVGLVTSRRTARALGGAEAVLGWALARLPRAMAVLAEGRRCDKLRGVAPLAHRCRQPYATCALLVGDAAGFLDPFTGEGVYRALRGADEAAAVADAALRAGDYSAAALAPYAARRRRAFAAKDRLCLLIQAFVAAPALLDYAVPRLNGRPEAAALAAALGDLAPAAAVLRPGRLLALLRP